MQYDEGSFCIEPVIFPTNPGERCLPKGVLITEKSMKEDFAILGIIIDEIEDIIQDYYPGLTRILVSLCQMKTHQQQKCKIFNF